MKNHFHVFIEILFALVFLFLCGIGSFIWFAVDAFGEDLSLSIFLTVMLVVLPTGLLIFGICTFAARIKVDENGITKSLFGKILKYYKWEEIDHIRLFGNANFVQSISFFKKRNNKSLLSRWSKYERIYFYCNEKKWLIVNSNTPNNIKEQLKI